MTYVLTLAAGCALGYWFKAKGQTMLTEKVVELRERFMR